MNGERVVVTGLGGLLPFGRNLAEIAACLRSEDDQDIEKYLSRKYGEAAVGLIPDEYFAKSLKAREQVRYDRISMMTATVVGECIKSAGLDGRGKELEKTGITSGSLFGTIRSDDHFRKTLYEEGSLKVDPMKFPFMSHNYPVSISAIKYGLKGPVTAIVSSLSSSLNALGFAHSLVMRNQAKRMIVIGFEEMTRLGYALLQRTGYINGEHTPRNAARRSAPQPVFEGATGIVIEKRKTAERRGAKIYGEILSWDASYGSFRKIDPLKIQKNIAKVVDKSPLKTRFTDLLLVNESGVESDDQAEKNALRILNSDGYLFAKTLALKERIGNYLGASGLVELVVSLYLMDKEIHPQESAARLSSKLEIIINKKDVNSLVINNFGFGGNIVTFLVARSLSENCDFFSDQGVFRKSSTAI